MLKLEGFEQLNGRFNALANVAKQSALSGALRARAEIVRDAAKRLAPTKTGALARGIQIKEKSETDVAEATTEVGTGSKQFYGYYQEFGTGRSFDAAAARSLGYPGRRRSYKHNQPAHPFLIPAARDTAVTSIAAAEKTLERLISQAENS